MKNKKHIILYTIGASCLLYFLPENIQLILAFLLILSIGLLHGSNDIKIIEQLKESNSRKRKIWSLMYGLLVLLTLGLFFLIPTIILPFFIAVSAYHFGEQHFEGLLKSKSTSGFMKYPLFISYGSYIFFLLFYITYDETQLVVSDISSLWLSRMQIGYILLTSILLFIFSLFFYVKDNAVFKQNLSDEFVFLFVFMVLFNFSSLLVGFALYFVFWHSLPSLLAQQRFLYQKIGIQGFKLYFSDSWKYWLISIVGLSIFWFFLYDHKNLYSILFAFVAAITFPHVVIMHQMFGGKKHVS